MIYYLLSTTIIALVLYFISRDTSINFSYFDNKNIIITGASSGIGKSIATILEQRTHANLFLLARSFETNENKFKCDCSNYDMLKEVISKIDSVDIVIHSAGLGDWKFLNEMDIKEVEACLGAPLMASINLTHLTLPKTLKINSVSMYLFNHLLYCNRWVVARPTW